MLPYFTEKYGNAASRNHAFGWEAEEAVDEARDQIADLIGATGKEIIFTSGATESNNLAIKGVAACQQGRENHIITRVTEHKAVLDTCQRLERDGFQVTYLPVQDNGLIDPTRCATRSPTRPSWCRSWRRTTRSAPSSRSTAIGKVCKEQGLFHTDAVQAVGKMPLDVEAMGIDLLSSPGTRCTGPKGIGALYVRRRPRVRLEPMIDGGGHERGMRSGTLPMPLIVGLGEACRDRRGRDGRGGRAAACAPRPVYNRIMAELPEVYLNGDTEQRLPGNLNLSFAYVEGEGLMMGIKDVAVSSGSACTSASLEPSYVLRALGVDDELAHTSLRFGIGRFTTEEEVDFVADLVVREVTRLREMSPLCEMAQEGIDLKSIQWAAH